MIRYKFLEGSIPEGCRVVSTRGELKLAGVVPLDPSLNPPIFNTPSGRLETIDEGEEFVYELDVSAHMSRTLTGSSIINGQLPWGLVIQGFTIHGEPAELLHKSARSFMPEEEPIWETKDGVLTTVGELAEVDINLLAETPIEERTLSFSIPTGHLPWGLILSNDGRISGVTGEATGELVPVSGKPVWVTPRGHLATLNEFEEYTATLSAAPTADRVVQYRISSGALPFGLVLSPSSGKITGSASELVIGGPHEDDFGITKPSVVNGSYTAKVGEAFSLMMVAVAPPGRSISNHEVASGSYLPAGLTLLGNTISGTPERPGTHSFNIIITDSKFVKSIPTQFTIEVSE